jgi:hypothetical protein
MTVLEFVDVHSSDKGDALPDTHTVLKTEVVLVNDMYGVRFEFDDGLSETLEVGGKNIAEFYAREQLGQELVVGSNPLFLTAEKVKEITSRLEISP